MKILVICLIIMQLCSIVLIIINMRKNKKRKQDIEYIRTRLGESMCRETRLREELVATSRELSDMQERLKANVIVTHMAEPVIFEHKVAFEDYGLTSDEIYGALSRNFAAEVASKIFSPDSRFINVQRTEDHCYMRTTYKITIKLFPFY